MDHVAESVEAYRAADEIEAEAIVQLLASHDIPAEVHGTVLRTILGELPPWHAAPRVCVPATLCDAAKIVIGQWETDRRQRRQSGDDGRSPFAVSSWTCPRCETEVEAQFDTCWNCRYSPRSC